MKTQTPKVLIILCFLCLLSCSSEPLDVEIQDIFNGDQNDNPEDAEDDTSGTTEIIPCDFVLSDITADTTVSINCIMDLKGESINLAPGIKLDFNGGSIENGTLNFSGGYIDGALMNHTLQIKGNVTLRNSTFEFQKEKWEIVEGNISADAAFDNRVKLENLISLTKKMGATSFKIDELDAYFNTVPITHVSGYFLRSHEAINIPSDFNLILTNNTHMRIYPNNLKGATLIAFRGVSNATITGGNLHGDRDEHDYSSGGSHEWSHLIEVHSASNCKITNVRISNATGDGLDIHALTSKFNSNYDPSTNVTVSGCTFDSNRRNNISITDGRNIIIENNTFLRAGINTAKSNGVAPRHQIDIEPYREKDGNGNFISHEIVDGVIIRNNVEKETAGGGLLIHGGENVVIEDNDVESTIVIQWANNSTIRNNNIIAPSGSTRENGIKTEWIGDETVHNNKIYGNFISGFKNGMKIMSTGHNIYNNKIENFSEKGVFFRKFIDMKFNHNTINSTNTAARGIFIYSTNADKSEIIGNTVNTISHPLYIRHVNEASGDRNKSFKVKENEFNSSSYSVIQETSGVDVENNKILSPLMIRKAQNIEFTNNLVNSKDSGRHSFQFKEFAKNIKVHYNNMIAPKGMKGTEIDTAIDSGSIDEKGNTVSYQ